MQPYSNKWILVIIFWTCWSLSQVWAQVPQRFTFDRPGNDQGKVIQLADKNIVLVGSTENGIDNDSQRDGMLTKVDPNTGEILWSRAYGTDNTDAFSDAIQAANSDIVAVGFADQGNTTNRAMWFTRINSTNGNIERSRRIGNTSNTATIAAIVESTVFNQGQPTFIVVGSQTNTAQAYIARLNIHGDVLWETNYNIGTSDWLTDVVEANDSTIYASGAVDGIPLIVEIEGNGNVQNSWRITGLATTGALNTLDWFMEGEEERLVLAGIEGVQGDSEPIFVELEPVAGEAARIIRATQYITGADETHRILDMKPYEDGWVVNIQDRGDGNAPVPTEMEIAFINRDGSIRNHLIYDVPNTWAENVFPLTNGMLAVAGGGDIDGVGDRQFTVNIVNSLGNNGCNNQQVLNRRSLGVIAPFNNNTFNSNQGTSVDITTMENNIEWNFAEDCDVCWASYNAEYIRLDPANPDPRIEDYGIAVNSGVFRINNGIYNRLPEKLYIADGVILEISDNTNGITIADMTDSDIVFGVGAGIRARGEVEVIINDATLRPCNEEDTWNGVTVSSPTFIEFECRSTQFINATVGIYVAGNVQSGNIANNNFLNCQFGIVGQQNDWNIPITGNNFTVNGDALALDYTDLATIRSLPTSVSVWGSTFFNQLNNRYFTGNGNPVMTGETFEGFAAIELMGLSINTVNNAIISQNQFINALPLTAQPLEYNGILTCQISGLNISGNTFTNNDRSVIAHYSRNISIENNLMEVTRRSDSDGSFYQILVIGSPITNQIGPSGIIKGNTLTNSAAPTNVTTNVLAEGAQGTMELINGTGAIYLDGGSSNLEPTRITNNVIEGFEIGIYKNGGVRSTQIVNNKINTHIVGIFQDGGSGLIGCNEINMDRVADIPVEGIHGSNGLAHDKLNWIYGNCIYNTDRAIALDDELDPIYSAPVPLRSNIYNNYFHNYTETAIALHEITNPSGVLARIRRNAFLSNAQGANDIAVTGSSTHPTILRISDNHVGADGLLNFLDATDNANGSTRYMTGTADWNMAATLDAPPVSACSNMDATALPLNNTEEAGWNEICDDELFDSAPALLARTADNELQLVSNFEAILETYDEEPTAVVDEIAYTLEFLSNSTEKTQLYQIAQQYDNEVESNTMHWLEVSYYKGNWAKVQQALNQIEPLNTAEFDRWVIARAQTDMAIRQATTIENATILEDLKIVATHKSIYKHEARELLNNSTDQAYVFEYNPVTLNARGYKNLQHETVFETASNILITPNPTSDYLTVHMLLEPNTTWSVIQIYDVHGKVLQTKAVTQYQEVMDVRQLPQGVYFITVEDNTGNLNTQKFIKR